MVFIKFRYSCYYYWINGLRWWTQNAAIATKRWTDWLIAKMKEWCIEVSKVTATTQFTRDRDNQSQSKCCWHCSYHHFGLLLKTTTRVTKRTNMTIEIIEIAELHRQEAINRGVVMSCWLVHEVLQVVFLCKDKQAKQPVVAIFKSIFLGWLLIRSKLTSFLICSFNFFSISSSAIHVFKRIRIWWRWRRDDGWFGWTGERHQHEHHHRQQWHYHQQQCQQSWTTISSPIKPPDDGHSWRQQTV